MERWWIAVSAGVAGLVVLIAINWQVIVLSLAIAIEGPGAPPPSLIEVAELSWGDESFSNFLMETFPRGTPTSDLVARLQQDVFEIGPDNHASLVWGSSWCSWHMRIHWVEVSDQLVEVTGRYDPICL
jgi:hypothetical protein